MRRRCRPVSGRPFRRPTPRDRARSADWHRADIGRRGHAAQFTARRRPLDPPYESPPPTCRWSVTNGTYPKLADHCVPLGTGPSPGAERQVRESDDRCAGRGHARLREKRRCRQSASATRVSGRSSSEVRHRGISSWRVRKSAVGHQQPMYPLMCTKGPPVHTNRAAQTLRCQFTYGKPPVVTRGCRVREVRRPPPYGTMRCPLTKSYSVSWRSW